MLKFSDIQIGEWFKRDEDEDDIVYCMRIEAITDSEGKVYNAINNYGMLLDDVKPEEEVLPCSVSFDAGDLLE